MLQSRPRLCVSMGLGLLTTLLLPATPFALHAVTRALIGWNVAAILYLLLALEMMLRSSDEHMRRRALQQDEGSTAILLLVVVAALACVVAIFTELAIAKDQPEATRYAYVGLSALTIATSWAFTHTMFALHYAHDYYATALRGSHGGLDFPGTETPDYGDFLYFAFIIGTSAQTADVALSSRSMRRTGLVHSVLAFFFNTTLLALTINMASGLI